MLNLIQNENIKIYRRLRTWILIGVLVILAATVLIIYHSATKSASTDVDWRTQLSKQIADEQQSLQSHSMPKVSQDTLKSDILAKQYRLDHNIAPEKRSLWNFVDLASNLIILVTIFTVIIAADSVAGEFSGGTIKLLLIRPASRSKVLLSKYLSTLLFSLVLLIVLFASSFVISGILEGFNSVSESYIYAGSNGVVHVVSMAAHVLGSYGYACIELIMIVTLGFMLSTVFRSSSLAIGLSLGIMFVGPTVATFLTRYSWAKYYLFENTDLRQYLNDTPYISGMTLGFSIAVLFVYFVLFNVMSWTIFKKRDIGA